MKKKKLYYKIIFSFSLVIVTVSSIIYIYEVRNKIKFFFGEFFMSGKSFEDDYDHPFEEWDGCQK